jgi:hypothetical protein
MRKGFNMTQETIGIVLEDGSELAINVKNIAYVHFVQASLGEKPHAEIFFVGRERPLGVGESVMPQLRAALSR